jgi:hypothetical protein
MKKNYQSPKSNMMLNLNLVALIVLVGQSLASGTFLGSPPFSFQDYQIFRLLRLRPAKSRLSKMAPRAWHLFCSRPAFHLLDCDRLRSPAVLNRHNNAEILHDSSVRRPLRKQPDNSAMVRLRARLYRPRARRLSGIESKIWCRCSKEKV